MSFKFANAVATALGTPRLAKAKYAKVSPTSEKMLYCSLPKYEIEIGTEKKEIEVVIAKAANVIIVLALCEPPKPDI